MAPSYFNLPQTTKVLSPKSNSQLKGEREADGQRQHNVTKHYQEDPIIFWRDVGVRSFRRLSDMVVHFLAVSSPTAKIKQQLESARGLRLGRHINRSIRCIESESKTGAYYAKVP
ncbi:hypothetical protein GGR51DRAFT_533821 [Nemania sp. FL0031]|nr:hypothetical protein GGR51DRAFT_533821 [Nemania sp. FL0031]